MTEHSLTPERQRRQALSRAVHHHLACADGCWRQDLERAEHHLAHAAALMAEAHHQAQEERE